jgi:hypothetical protein
VALHWPAPLVFTIPAQATCHNGRLQDACRTNVLQQRASLTVCCAYRSSMEGRYQLSTMVLCILVESRPFLISSIRGLES